MPAFKHFTYCNYKYKSVIDLCRSNIQIKLYTFSTRNAFSLDNICQTLLALKWGLLKDILRKIRMLYRAQTHFSSGVAKYLFSSISLCKSLLSNILAVKAPDSPDTFQTYTYYVAPLNKQNKCEWKVDRIALLVADHTPA